MRVGGLLAKASSLSWAAAVLVVGSGGRFTVFAVLPRLIGRAGDVSGDTAAIVFAVLPSRLGRAGGVPGDAAGFAVATGVYRGWLMLGLEARGSFRA